ncbi:MAG: glycosyltransferase [Gemmataceae bacterium]|nr:glycosyltransferase [Gemmataceae bacterium]
MPSLDDCRVVLVHDWLTGMRGGEKVLEVFCRRWPQATLYTLLHKRGSVSPTIEALVTRTSYLQWLPRVHRYYRYLLPLMPRAVGWRLPDCDLVLSSSHCVAKGVQAPAGVPHVCYCYTPMRYAWHMRDAYFQRGLKGWLVDRLLSHLRDWDCRTAQGVTHFIAISATVQERVRQCYGRDSVVIHPPVDTEFYTPSHVAREDFYLVLSALAPYKRVDLAVAACAKLGRRLVIIGTGQDEKKLRRLARSNVQFLGWQADDVLRDHLRRCRALLFPGEEDFGIVPVEAQACGAPVIAYGRGGATETVVPLPKHPCPTGVWFEEQTTECLSQAIQEFERHEDTFDPAALRRHALQFNSLRFEREIFAYLAAVVAQKSKKAA